MAFRVVRSTACDKDLETIFDYLFLTYRDLGDPVQEALDRAARRVLEVEVALEGLGEVPFQGTLETQIMDRLRHVTKDRAVFYFTVDEASEELRVLAVFFGGQDHRNHLLERIRTGRVGPYRT